MVVTIQKSKTLRALLAGTLLIGFFLFSQSLNSKVSATSVYDDVYQRETVLEAIGYNTAHDVSNTSCTTIQQHDLLDWGSRLTDTTAGSSSGTFSTFKTYYQDVIIDGDNGGWSVSTAKFEYQDKQIVTVTIWKGTADLVWSSPSSTPTEGSVSISGTGITTATAVLDVFCSSGNWVLQEQSPNPNNLTNGMIISRPLTTVGGYPSVIKNVFVSGDYNPNYPTGYVGLPIFTSIFDPNGSTYADFDVNVEAFNITATYRGTEYDNPKCTSLIWRFVNADEPLAVVQYHTNITEPLTITVPEAGTYRLDLTWEWRISQMDAVGLNPADEPYCTDLNDVILDLYAEGLLPKDTGKVFPVDGLSSLYLGQDGNRECFLDDEPGNGFGQSQVCVYSTGLALEDCSIYGIDELHTRLGCEIGNLFTRIRGMFNDMWTVRPYFLSNRIADFQNHVDNNMSILTYPVVFGSEIVTATTSSATTCPTAEFDFMGSNADIDICSMETMNPATWTFIQVGATSIFAFLFVSVLIGAYHRIWSSKE